MKKKNLQLYQKSFGLKAASGAEVTPEILTKINQYTLKPLTAEDVFVRKYLMAHNAVDRDNERFPEILLDDFAKTFPGKSLLNGHNRQSLPLGLYFDALTEEMTPEQFKALTGEQARLPENSTAVKVLWGWIYMLKADFNEAMMANIDAGIYRHASIGFRASDLNPVKGRYENILYWEYVPPGEALEGSIVWLGAQPGATAQKRAKSEEHRAECENCPNNPSLEGEDKQDIPSPLVGEGKGEGGTKGAVSFSPTTPADEGRAWDAGAAKSRLAKWASSDGSGDKDTIDWGKYRKGFGWFNADNPENIGSYKLPHHDIIDGELSVVWQGVSAAMAALMGARGGVDIPDGDVDSVYNHFAKHYKQFDKEPPEKVLDPTLEKGGKGGFEKGGNKPMKNLIERLKKMFNRSFSEDEGTLADEIKAMLNEKDTTITEKETRIKELEPLAADGKAYRDDLITKYVSLKAKLGEVTEVPEAQEKVKKVAGNYPMDFLKSEVEVLQERVDEKFPTEAQTKGDERQDKSADGGEKDYTKDNPLTPKKEGK